MKDDMIRRVGTVTKVHGGTYEVEDNETNAPSTGGGGNTGGNNGGNNGGDNGGGGDEDTPNEN